MRNFTSKEKIEIVNEYKYLGIIFSSSILFRKAAEDMKKKALKAMYNLWPVMQKENGISREEVDKLFIAMIRSTLYSIHFPNLGIEILRNSGTSTGQIL